MLLKIRRLNRIDTLASVSIAAGGAGFALLAGSVEQVYLGFTVLALLLPYGVHVLRTGFDLLSPATLFIAIYILLFVARTGLVLSAGEVGFYGLGAGGSMRAASGYATVGATAFAVGYYPRVANRIALRVQPSASVSSEVLFRYGLTLTAIGISLFAIFIISSGGWVLLAELARGRSPSGAAAFAGSTQYVSQGVFLLIPASLCIWASGETAGENGRRWIGWLVVLAVGFLAFPLGTRRWLLVVVGSFYALRTMIRRKRPNMLAVGILVLLVLLVGVTFVREARVASHRQAQGLTSIFLESVTDPSRAVETIVESNDTEPAVAFSVVLEVSHLPAPRYGWGIVEDALISTVPRIVWEGKPYDRLDELRVALFGQPCSGAPGSYCPTFTILTDFYIEGRGLGVAVGMYLFGLCWGTANHLRHRMSSHVGVLILFAAALPYVVLLVRTNIVPVVAWMGIVVGPTIPLVFGRGPAVLRRLYASSNVEGGEVGPVRGERSGSVRS